MNFENSNQMRKRFQTAIPGGSHTYAKGDDQFPEHMAPIIARGKGCRVWDVDGNEFIEYGSGMRAISLGHAFEPVLERVRAELELGSNFIRPAAIEMECAEKFQSIIPHAEMVKFCKDGSDATSGALKLARAYTGKNKVAVCANHPFFAVDDWFIGSSAMPGGIPSAIRELTLKFKFNDNESIDQLFCNHGEDIAAIILEAEKETPPTTEFLEAVKRNCSRYGTVFILDEMITGFRWHNGGAQSYYGIQPDLSTFGKAMANGFSVSALTGRKELMQLGGWHHADERVFLMSTTHGAETHGLGAAIATMEFYQAHPVVETLWKQGERLKRGIEAAASAENVSEFVPVLGKPCCLVFGSRDSEGNPSQPFRTLLMQELIKRGILASSIVVNFSHSDQDIDQTVDAFAEAFKVYRKAIENGVEKYLESRPVKPALRPYA